jgi:hypothetical protein
MDIVNFLKDNSFVELYRLLLLDFKKFIKLKKGFTNKELRKLLLKRYYNFINIYLWKGTDILPLYEPDDYAINIKYKKMLLYKRPYLISKDELLVVKKYINKHLNKGFIRLNISLITAPILLAKKLGGSIQFYVNYKGLNAIIIKN